MATHRTVTCAEPGCGAEFTAQSPRARFCSARCRKAASRRPAEPKAEPTGTAAGAPTSGRRPKDPLVLAVEKELKQLGALDSVDGQIALHLAHQVKAATGSSASSLAKELRTVLDRVAGASAGPKPSTQGAPPAEAETKEDEITRLRKARERKAREASAG